MPHAANDGMWCDNPTLSPSWTSYCNTPSQHKRLQASQYCFSAIRRLTFTSFSALTPLNHTTTLKTRWLLGWYSVQRVRWLCRPHGVSEDWFYFLKALYDIACIRWNHHSVPQRMPLSFLSASLILDILNQTEEISKLYLLDCRQ